MNIFAVAWKVPELNARRIQAELHRIADVYGSLDKHTVSTHSCEGTYAAGCISSAKNAAGPRVYAARNSEEITIYSGLPVDPRNEISAHDAAQLLAEWQNVRDRLEGTYAVVRLHESAAVMEVQTDIIGGEPVYYCGHEGGWLISNSVLLLERLTAHRSLDELGASMFLHLGHVLGSRTLRTGIHVIPGAQRWTWSRFDSEPVKTDYYPWSRLANRPRDRLTSDSIGWLAEELQAPLASFRSNFDSLVCPLTGGKDSRVVASLLIAAGIDARYFTFGAPEGDDSIIAKMIAAQFNLPHELMQIDESSVLEEWDFRCSQNVRAADGMRSLYLLAGLLKSRPVKGKAIDVYLWGACGEIARGYFGDQLLLRPSLSLEHVKQFMKTSGPPDSFGLVTSDAIACARRWREDSIYNIADQGFNLADIPDIYGNHIVDARRLGNNGRGLAETRDTYSPFATRAFFESTFALSAIQRCTEPLHFGLCQTLVPKLHGLPLAKSRWLPQNPYINLIRQRATRDYLRFTRRLTKLGERFVAAKPTFHYQDSMFNRLGWLEHKRERIREVALDTRQSSLWQFVNRDRFEDIMSATTHRSVRSRNLHVLLQIATLAYYENDTERTRSSLQAKRYLAGS